MSILTNIFCTLNYFLGTRTPGSTTISTSVASTIPQPRAENSDEKPKPKDVPIYRATYGGSFLVAKTINCSGTDITISKFIFAKLSPSPSLSST